MNDTLGQLVFFGSIVGGIMTLWSTVDATDARFNLAGLKPRRVITVFTAAGDTLRGRVLETGLWPDSLYSARLKTFFAEQGFDQLPLDVGEEVIVPGKYKAGRKLGGRFLGFSRGGVLFSIIRPGREKTLVLQKIESLQTLDGREVAPEGHLRQGQERMLPAREFLRIDCEGEIHTISLDELDRFVIYHSPWGLVFMLILGLVAGSFITGYKFGGGLHLMPGG